MLGFWAFFVFIGANVFEHVSVLGFIPVLFGLPLLAHRDVWWIDTGSRRIVHRIGLVVPFLNVRVFAFSAFEQVRVAFDEGSSQAVGGEDSGYYVTVSGPSVGFPVLKTEDLGRARAVALRVARLVNIAFCDEATGAGRVEPGQLAAPLREMLLRTKHLAAPRPLPEGSRVVVTEGGSEVCLVLPRAGFGQLVPLGGLLVVSLAMLVALMVSEGPPILAALALLEVVGVAPFFWLKLRSSEASATVWCSPRRARVVVRGIVGERAAEWSAAEVMSVGVATLPSWFVTTRAIVVCTARNVFHFGTGCTDDERAWVLHAMQYALTANQTSRAAVR